jgi:thioredoxin 1
MKAIDVTDENFNHVVLQSGKTVLVDFSAEWCPPCKGMKPVLNQIADEFENKALIGMMDVDHNPQITAKYGVRNLPSFLIFKDGNLVERVVGAVPKSVLTQRISALL